MNIGLINILVGGLLLVLGRKLFWFFVAASGFVAGIYVASRVLSIHPEWLVLVIGLVLGVIGAVAAIFIQRVAVGIAGAIAGAYVALVVAAAFGFDKGLGFWIAVAIGGIIGASLVAVIFDWALILLSSLVGASIIMEALNLQNPYAWLGLLILCVVGVLVQAGIKTREGKTAESVPQQRRSR